MMPKTANSKKRKREKKKDEDRGAKKAKSKDDEDGLVEDVGDHESELLPSKEEEELDYIDDMLEENAARNNLTAINVKSILHVSLFFNLTQQVSKPLVFSAEIDV